MDELSWMSLLEAFSEYMGHRTSAHWGVDTEGFNGAADSEGCATVWGEVPDELEGTAQIEAVEALGFLRLNDIVDCQAYFEFPGTENAHKALRAWAQAQIEAAATQVDWRPLISIPEDHYAV